MNLKKYYKQTWFWIAFLNTVALITGIITLSLTKVFEFSIFDSFLMMLTASIATGTYYTFRLKKLMDKDLRMKLAISFLIITGLVLFISTFYYKIDASNIGLFGFTLLIDSYSVYFLTKESGELYLKAQKRKD